MVRVRFVRVFGWWLSWASFGSSSCKRLELWRCAHTIPYRTIHVCGTCMAANGFKALEHISPEVAAQVASAGIVTNIFGSTTVQIQWSRLRDILASFLPPDSIHFDVPLTALGSKPSSSRADFGGGGGGDVSHYADLFVAADGVHSSARALLDPSLSQMIEESDGYSVRRQSASLPPPQQLGRTIFRSVVDLDDAKRNGHIALDPGATSMARLGDGVMFASMKLSSVSHQHYWAVSVEDSYSLQSPEARDFAGRGMESSEGAGVRGDMGGAGRASGDGDGGRCAGDGSVKSFLLRVVAGNVECEGLLNASDEVRIVVRRSIVRDMCPAMVVGRIVLLGDAAHAVASTGEVRGKFARALFLCIGLSRSLARAHTCSLSHSLDLSLALALATRMTHYVVCMYNYTHRYTLQLAPTHTWPCREQIWPWKMRLNWLFA